MTDTVVVTGGAGFIGSNIVRALNLRGVDRVLVVDNLGNNADKFRNLVDCEILDYVDKQAFLEQVEKGCLNDFRALFHQGACSDTMEQDGHYMMANNYEYSKILLHAAQQAGTPFFYASSASVYGGGTVFREQRELEAPLNVYGYSKFLFDQYVRRHFHELKSQVAGFRYFNVYGPGEAHKGRMASVAWHFYHQYQEQGFINLFKGSGGFDDGEQRRDFIHVDDVVAVNLHFYDRPELSGIFNLGTGQASSFNQVGLAVINALAAAAGSDQRGLESAVKEGLIRYIDFPEGLQKRYQSFTEADISALRQEGWQQRFFPVEEGVSRYVEHLETLASVA